MSSTSAEVVVGMEKLVNSMKGNLETLGEISENREGGRRIRRVLPSLRRDCEEDYGPKIISIGPLHRNNEALKPMEALKWRYLRLLIRRNPERNKLENYIKAVHSVKEKAMEFYEPDELGAYCNNLDGGFDEFVEMMVLDGCFIIEYLYRDRWGQINDDVPNQHLPLLRRDLLLVENQIPFIILQTLFTVITDLVSLEVFEASIMELAVYFVTMHMSHSVSLIPDDTIHLLHVYHACLHPPTPNYDASLFSLFPKMMRRILRLAAAPFFLLLSCLLTCKIPTNFWRYRYQYFFRPEPMGVLPANQLYNLGVNFKKKVRTTLCEATFDEGILELPVFPANQASISTFRNLMAFEQMYPTGAGYYINNYAVLMSSLVRAAEDVAMLKDSGIIDGPLDHGHVVQLFAQLRSMGSKLDYYSHRKIHNLLEDLQEYCSTAHNKWRADFKRTYFGSPWTVASLIAATFILFLTAAQIFYTMLAYHHPPS